jgi:hypothetical protein
VENVVINSGGLEVEIEDLNFRNTGSCGKVKGLWGKFVRPDDFGELGDEEFLHPP